MRNRVLFMIGLLLLSLTVPTWAQLNDEGTLFTFQNGLALTIPDGWKVAQTDNAEKDAVSLDDGRTGLRVLLYYPDTLVQANITTPADVIADQYNTIYKIDITNSDVEDVTVGTVNGGRYASTVTTDKDEFDQVAYAFMLPDGYALLGLIYPMKGSGLRSTSEEDAKAILESVLAGAATLPSDGSVKPGDIDLTPIGPNNGDSDTTSDNAATPTPADVTEHEFGYMTTLTLPEGWSFEDSSADSLISDGKTKIEFAFYTPHRAGLKGRSPEDLLIEYFKTVNNAKNNPVDLDKVQPTTIAGVDAVSYKTTYSPDSDTQYDLTAVSVILPNEAGIVAAIYPANGDQLESEFKALSVIEDFVSVQPAVLETIDLGYAVTFNVPRGWAVFSKKTDASDLDNGATSLSLQSYYPSSVESNNLKSAADVLGYYMQNIYPDVPFDVRDAESIKLGRLKAARFSYDAKTQDSTYPRVVVAVLLDDGQRGLVADIIPVQGARLVGEEETLKIFQDMVAQIDNMPTTFEFVDGSVFDFPTVWNYYSSTDNYFVNMDNNLIDLSLDMYTPKELDGKAATPRELIEFYWGEAIADTDIKQTESGGVTGVRFETTRQDNAGVDYQAYYYAFMLSNGYGLIVSTHAYVAGDFNERDVMRVIDPFVGENR